MFQPIMKSQHNGARVPLINTVRATATGNQIHIIMSNDIYARLGNPKRVLVSVGREADYGRIQIDSAPAGDINGYAIHKNGPSSRTYKVQVAQSHFGYRQSVKASTVTVPFTLTVNRLTADLMPMLRKADEYARQTNAAAVQQRATA